MLFIESRPVRGWRVGVAALVVVVGFGGMVAALRGGERGPRASSADGPQRAAAIRDTGDGPATTATSPGAARDTGDGPAFPGAVRDTGARIAAAAASPAAVGDLGDRPATAAATPVTDSTSALAGDVVTPSGGHGLRPERAEGRETQRARPPSAPGHLSISSRPWGALYVDGRLIGNTPQRTIALTPGAHDLRVVRDGFRPFEQWLVVRSGQEVRIIDVQLEVAR